MIDAENETRVEISGWDLSEQFFVERGSLQEEQGEGKKMTLHRQVRIGGLVFLRLLNHAQAGMSFPVAFRVRELRAEPQGGTFEVSLRQMWPKPKSSLPGATPRVDATRPEWLGMK